ncbi:hypothetical protein ERJ75_000859500 [Trypanosoma vivax]|uniref:Uncharacterized protein n=1 Tax=Trypanosoma vivax (strain Y486) TaxID=1055687 RepID=F9WNV8_TRYVY|nr:hypothetical protein ERJ75_000859500 [Trypanosoma vivax]CCD19229.1 hypothetical protein, conserved in T. vivax [Trypanosoma vivax Y486]|eukprot:CCD19229.1 hypothetical protein, conserved in T. vivax [Trypanosoma vivax Y486]
MAVHHQHRRRQRRWRVYRLHQVPARRIRGQQLRHILLPSTQRVSASTFLRQRIPPPFFLLLLSHLAQLRQLRRPKRRHHTLALGNRPLCGHPDASRHRLVQLIHALGRPLHYSEYKLVAQFSTLVSVRMFHAYDARACLEGPIASRPVPTRTSNVIQYWPVSGLSVDFQLEISQSLRKVMSGDESAAVRGCRLVADPALAIDRSFCTHQSTMHSLLSSLGPNGSHNAWCELTTAPAANGPLAPSKVSSDSLEASAFLGKYADVTVRLTLAENLSVTVALSGTFFSSTPTSTPTPSLTKIGAPPREASSPATRAGIHLF